MAENAHTADLHAHTADVAVSHHRHDSGWPELPAGEHAVTELSSSRSGGLSPFGEVIQLPLPAEDLPYVHPVTVPNR